MIAATQNCGCEIKPLPCPSKTSILTCCSDNLSSCSLLGSCDLSDDSTVCTCCGSSKPETDKCSQKKLVSEIAAKGKPYKEIEAIVNNNRVIVRVQSEKPKPDLEPPCDCLDSNASEIQSAMSKNTMNRRSSITFQKAREGCRTISVYPHPDPKVAEPSRSEKFDFTTGFPGFTSKRNIEPPKLPTVNPEENPNIFVLKIKRKCENGDKKHNLDLEFRVPRPWSKKSQRTPLKN